jgi:hypothetical protein
MTYVSVSSTTLEGSSLVRIPGVGVAAAEAPAGEESFGVRLDDEQALMHIATTTGRNRKFLFTTPPLALRTRSNPTKAG